MRKLACILFVLRVSALGLCPSNLKVDVTDSSLRVQLHTDVLGRTTAIRLRYGVEPGMNRQTAPKLANHDKAATRFLNVTDLAPGLPKLYFDPQVSDAGGRRWSDYASCQVSLCPSAGEQPGGYACEPDGRGALIPYVPTPPDTGTLDPPQPPRHTRANPRQRPEINGKVTTLTDCSAVQQAFNDHAAGGSRNPNLNHEIRLPAGAICRPEQENSRAGKNLAAYTLPPKRGSGVTVVTCDWDADEGPPPGVQYTPELRTARACGFGLNRRTVSTGSAFETNGALFLSRACNAPPCTEGWRFEGLVVEAGDWREISSRKVAITSVDMNTGRMTTAEPIDALFSTHSEMIVSLPGIRTMVTRQRQHVDYNQRGCMAYKFGSNEIACYGVARMTGEYKGGGFISAAQGYPIKSCAASGETVSCTLAEPHGLGGFYPFPIASLRGGLLEIDGEGHGWTAGAAIRIEGSSGCDGIYNIEKPSSPRTAKLSGSTCTASGGAARRLYTGRFFDLKGAGAGELEGVQLVDFPAPDQVRAFRVPAGAAAIESGGFVYTNPKVAAMFSLKDVARVTWDRVLFSFGAPFRLFNVIGIGNDAGAGAPCDCALLDSFVDGLHFWQPITPGAGVVDSAQTYPAFSAVPVVMRSHQAHDVQIDGLTLRDSAAFAFFADQFGAPGPQDVTFRGLSVAMTPSLVGGPHSKGLAYNLRHFIEVKGGARLLFENIQIQNWPSVGVSGASPLYFAYGGNDPVRDRLMQDITLRNIFMRNVSVGIGIRSANAHGYAAHQPIRRVLMDNILIDGIDYPNMQSSPHNQTLGVARTFFDTPVGNGSAIAIGGPAEDVRITRVTARRLRSKGTPNFLWMQDARVNNFQVDRSIVSFSPSGPEQNGLAVYATNKLEPPIAGGGATAFFEWTRRLDGPDPRSWFGTKAAPVGVIPCLQDSSTRTPGFDAKNNVKSLADRAFSCSGKDCGRWNVRIAGKDRESCAEREAQVLNQDLQGIGPFEGLGADTSELAKALGYLPAKVVEVGPNGGKLIYRPLTEESCVIEHSRDAGFQSRLRGRDAGGSGDRTMMLGGYKPGETVHYRILCPRSVQVVGSFQTK